MTGHLLRHLVLAAATSAAGLAACEGCRSTGNTAPTAAPALEGAPPTVRLYLVTDLAGALEPCGCTKDQLGGLDHFGAWVKHEQARVPAAMVASAGPLFFMDDKLEGDRADQDRIKAQTIAHVLHGLGFAAFAPGANDWDDGREGLERLAQASGGALVLGDGGAIVREVAGIRVGFVGYGQSKEKEARDVEGTVRRGVEEAKKQGAEVLVALAAVGRGEAKRIADAVPELTAVVAGSARSAGDSNTTAPLGEEVGDVVVVHGSNHLQSVAVLDLYVPRARRAWPRHPLRRRDGPRALAEARGAHPPHRRAAHEDRELGAGPPGAAPAGNPPAACRQELTSLEAQRDGLDTKPPPARGSFFRYTLKEMRDSLGKDPGVESDMLGYYKAVDDHNRTAFAGRVPQPAPADQASYVGIEVCSSCHPGPREVWSSTPHSRAYATLASQFKEFNLECVSCHVTGYERPGGSTVTHVDKLEDVQCEVCHGPGSRHVQSPSDRTRIVAVPDGATCLGCHHPPHVEGFDPAVKMKEILGPGHGLPR